MALVFVDLKMTGYVLVFSSLKLLHRNLFSMIKPFTLVRLFVSCSDQIGLSFPSLSKTTIVPQRSNPSANSQSWIQRGARISRNCLHRSHRSTIGSCIIELSSNVRKKPLTRHLPRLFRTIIVSLSMRVQSMVGPLMDFSCNSETENVRMLPNSFLPNERDRESQRRGILIRRFADVNL